MAINMRLLIITLNINGLNDPIKTQGDWIKKQKPKHIRMLPSGDSRPKDSESDGMKRDISCNRNEEKKKKKLWQLY